MVLLLDIGNTHTHVGIADGKAVRKQKNVSTILWASGEAQELIRLFVEGRKVSGAAICSVVPSATPFAKEFICKTWKVESFELRAATAPIGIDYPKPDSIGPDRLANAIAAKNGYGTPVVVVDFGTAVTFDVVNPRGKYVGGIIAPGLAAMTDYLHEKTALLPRITIREVDSVIGKNTEEAMLIGAVHGYRGLVRELLGEIKKEMGAENFPVVATGGYAALMASKLPEIKAVEPNLTLEGLRLCLTAPQAADSIARSALSS